MMAFSVVEFNTMMHELIEKQPASYDMLCHIAKKTLESRVRSKCISSGVLPRKEYEDVMQEVYCRLIKTSINSFFRRNGVDGGINDNPTEFQKWMFTVADNITIDYIKKAKRRLENCRNFVEDEEDDIAGDITVPNNLDDDTRETLSQGYNIVIGLNIRVYKILTWIAHSYFIVALDVTGIQANELILRVFRHRTLREMWGMLYHLSTKISWMKTTDEQKEKIEKSLSVPYDDTHEYGEKLYKAFFMKKGEKATLSDWINRVNNMARKVIGNGAFDG